MRIFILLFFTCNFLNSQDKLSKVVDGVVNGELSSYDLVLQEVKESKSAFHYTYQQLIENLPVYGSCFKLSVSKSGVLLNSYRKLYEESRLIKLPNSNHNCWSELKGELLPAIVSRIDKNGYQEDHIDFGSELIVVPLYTMKNLQDTIISVMVFEPDPLTSAEVEYGGDYIDNDNADSDFLNNERVQRFVNASLYNGNYLLENKYVKIDDVSMPTNTVSVKQDSIFHFTRSETGFEEVNILYHLTEIREYVDSLGFNVMNYQMVVDAHALGDQDNSMFVSSTNPPRLLFGDGGVDDGEDTDVIMHEFGHALVESCAPNSNSGNERKAIDEGNADYLAASYSRSFSDYNWENVFSWDGHNEFWDGRFVVTNDHYPEDLKSNFYDNADIWSASLMELNSDLGREVFDEILIESYFMYHMDMTMPEAAQYLIRSDSLLNSGENYVQILTRMANRGILPWDTINSVHHVHDLSFEETNHDFIIINDRDFSINYTVLDIRGRNIESGVLQKGMSKLIKKDNFVKILHLRTERHLLKSYKINRLR